jgi:type IV pilus assembly protein PilC
MPANYFYEATDGSGQTVLGKVDAANEQDAHRRIIAMGYRPKSVALNPASSQASLADSITLMGAPQAGLRPQQGQVQTAAVQNRSVIGGNLQEPDWGIPVAVRRPVAAPDDRGNTQAVKSSELMSFFQMLAPLVKSGMTIFAALDNVASRFKEPTLAKIAGEAAKHIRAGGSFSDTLACYPRVFPDHIVAMVRAGEIGGFLEIVLAEISLNYEQNVALYRGVNLMKAWIVQAFVTLAVVIPLFPSILNSEDIKANLALYFKREMIILPIFAVLFAVGYLLNRRMQSLEMRRWRDRISLKLPAFGNLQRLSALASFIRMLRKLHQAGVGHIQAWEAAMNTADNSVIREQLSSVYMMVNRGASLSEALAATKLFGDNIEQIVVTGELSGTVNESLDRAADIYVERVQDAHKAARAEMWRITRVTVLVVGGAALLWTMKSYFAAVFHFADGFSAE